MTSKTSPTPPLLFLKPNPGEVSSLELLLRNVFLLRIYQKTLYGSECKICHHGCWTILAEPASCLSCKGFAKFCKEV